MRIVKEDLIVIEEKRMATKVENLEKKIIELEKKLKEATNQDLLTNTDVLFAQQELEEKLSEANNKIAEFEKLSKVEYKPEDNYVFMSGKYFKPIFFHDTKEYFENFKKRFVHEDECVVLLRAGSNI